MEILCLSALVAIYFDARHNLSGSEVLNGISDINEVKNV
jgi:hypothetical protein